MGRKEKVIVYNKITAVKDYLTGKKGASIAKRIDILCILTGYK